MELLTPPETKALEARKEGKKLGQVPCFEVGTVPPC